MYAIKWVMHEHEAEPVEEETSCHGDLDAVVLSCQRRLSIMREKHPFDLPDGFLVFDDEGNEVRRWFRSPRSHFESGDD
jgi:hypothetical protein